MNGNKNELTIAGIMKRICAAAAAAVIMSGSAVSAIAADPGLPGEDVAASADAQLVSGTSGTNGSTAADKTASSSDTSTSEKSSTEAAKTSAVKKVTLAKGSLKSEVKYSSGDTHPWGRQTKALRVRWNEVSGAQYYQLAIKGGKYTKWTLVRNFPATMNYCTLSNLERDTAYKFKVRAYANKQFGKFSDIQTLRTGRIDFDKNGWKAMCRIVYHEVGRAEGSVWDEPIVHVADCVVNRYEAAKYLNDPTWAPYYSGYSSIQQMIYNSGGFMSSAGLTNDGASYANVTSRVRLAVYAAVYNRKVNGISHNRKIYFWMNGSSKPTSSKCAYVYSIPWGGYFSIWSEYWG